MNKRKAVELPDMTIRNQGRGEKGFRERDIIELNSTSAIGTMPVPVIAVETPPQRQRPHSTQSPVISQPVEMPRSRAGSRLSDRLAADHTYWNTFAAAHPHTSILQSYEWAEVKRHLGWRAQHLIIEEDGLPVAGAQILLHSTPIGPFAYIPHGPLLDWHRPELVRYTFSVLHRMLRRNLAFAVKIEPAYPNNTITTTILEKHGFRPADTIQPRSTIIVDLRPDIDTLSARLNIKMRYNMRLAQRRGVTCFEGTAADIPLFYRLIQSTSQRAGFPIHDMEYYRRAWHVLEQRGMAQLLFAAYGDEVLAATMLFVLGDRAYSMYSGSSELHRNLKPNDFLQWESIKWAKSMGCTSYDLWGIPDEIGRRFEMGESLETDDLPPRQQGELWGVYQFKRGLGGQITRFCGSYDYVYSPIGYWLYKRALPRLNEFRQSLRERRMQLAQKRQLSPTEQQPEQEAGE